jgi:hypothetical protein
LAAAGVSIWSAQAAIELEYFVVLPTEREVTLQWATAAEYDLSGFEVQCKRTDELDNAYHVIGSLPARGGPQQGATYIFPITSGLQRGVSYCFRLREVTTTGRAEDIQDRCGYGLGIAPTPTLSLTLTDTAALRATEAALQITATSIAAANIATAIANTNATLEAIRLSAALSATAEISLTAVATPTLTALAQLTATVPFTGGATPAGDLFPQPALSMTVAAVDATLAALSGTQAALGATLTAAATVDSAAAQSETPTPPGGQSPLEPGGAPASDQPTPDPNNAAFTATAAMQTPTLDPFAPPITQTNTVTATLPTEGLTPTGAISTPLASEPPNDPTIAAEIEQALAAAAYTPTPPYVVVTFTPVTPAAPAPATLTPLPVATPTPLGGGLVNFIAPTTQNLTLMLLCLTFFTASGLGILGLITSAIYMRSRRDDAEPPERQWW